jgi:CheY-like chemotaxis protein
MDEWERRGARLVLLVDADRHTRHAVSPLLVAHRLELVHARAGIAALELLQRMPEHFRLAVVNLDLPDFSGAAIIETLRHFRPKLPVVCLTESEGATALAEASPCLPKPFQEDDLSAQLKDALAGLGSPVSVAMVAPDVIRRATAIYTVSGNLIDAARELARGMSGESGGDW